MKTLRTLIAGALLSAGLVAAPLGRADPVDAYTATGSPTAVQPLAVSSYTITLTNDAGSPDSATRATVGIPSGFTVSPMNLSAATTGAGSCIASTWSATLNAAGTQIVLTSPNGKSGALCPGASLTVQFQATAPLAEATFTWTTQLQRGATTFTLSGVDPTVRVDGTAPPVPTVESSPPVVSGSSSAAFGFSDSEPGVGFECEFDGATFSSCASPKSYGGLDDGPHTFRVRARDTVGNTSRAAEFRWTIDTVAPTVTLTSMPGSLTNDPTPSFGFSASESGSTFSCKLDEAAFAACTSGVTYPAQADGAHTFVVEATDVAGNTSPEIAYSWTIDTMSPSPPVLQSSPPDVTASTSATFEFSDSEGGVTFECRLDGASFSFCNSPKDYIGLGDGAHTFRVRARDAADNVSALTIYSWTVDTVNPVVTIASGPAHATNQTSASFIFSANKPPAETTFECSLDSGGLAACTSAATYSSLADGTHTFRVRATYPPGNTGLATSYTWTIDTAAPPSPAIGGGPPSATNQRAATFVFADGEVGASFTCQLDSGPIASCSSPKSYGGLADGPHTFAVRVQDAVGNVSGPSTYTWTVDTVAPDTTISSGPGLASSSASVSFTFASNEASASFACSLDGGAFSPCTSPQTYGGLADGPHTLAVRAVDAAGNVDSTPASWTWTVATPRAPDTTPPARVSRLTAAVGYRLVRLSWRLPRDPDFDHVSVFVSTNKRGPLQGSVYTGNGTTFAYKRFRNGTYYRFAVISYDRAGNHSVEARVAVMPSALLRSPRDGAGVRKPPLLSWMAVSGATYYNVQLVYGGRKILSAWPKQPRLQLRRSWRYGGAHRLKKGLYNWYVWPGLGARSAARYGQLLGHGSFVVL